MHFGISSETVKVVIWISVLHEMAFDGLLEAIGTPSQLENQSSLPSSFSSKVSNFWIVVDFTEVRLQFPEIACQNRTVPGHITSNEILSRDCLVLLLMHVLHLLSSCILGVHHTNKLFSIVGAPTTELWRFDFGGHGFCHT